MDALLLVTIVITAIPTPTNSNIPKIIIIDKGLNLLIGIILFFFRKNITQIIVHIKNSNFAHKF